MIARVLPVVLVGLSLSTAAIGQTAQENLEQGIRAYRDLEMQSATWLLRQALAVDGDGALSLEQRKSALTYLGAAELYRDRRDSAVAAFASVIVLDPLLRPDRLVFAPEVLELFDEVRHATPAVALRAPSRVEFDVGRGALPIRLYVSTPHRVVVSVESVNRRALQQLARRDVSDSAVVRWDGSGRDASTSLVGGLIVSVVSEDAGGNALRRVELPIHVVRTTFDSLAHPSQPALLPEREPYGPAFLRLGIGLAAAAGAYVLFNDTGTKIAAAGVLAGAGVIGFVQRRPGRPLPDNVVANEAARARWRAQVEAAARENRGRPAGEHVVIEVGQPTIRR